MGRLDWLQIGDIATPISPLRHIELLGHGEHKDGVRWSRHSRPQQAHSAFVIRALFIRRPLDRDLDVAAKRFHRRVVSGLAKHESSTPAQWSAISSLPSNRSTLCLKWVRTTLQTKRERQATSGVSYVHNPDAS